MTSWGKDGNSFVNDKEQGMKFLKKLKIANNRNVLFFSLLLCAAQVHAQFKDEEYTSLLAKTTQYIDRHRIEVWPGFRLSDYPLVMNIEGVDPSFNTHVYAFQFTPKDPSLWKELTIENMSVYLRENFYIHNEYGFQQLDGQTVYVYPFYNMNDVNDPKSVINIITKTLFHDYQFFHSKFPVSALNKDQYAYTGFNEIYNIAWVEIEREILKNYLLNNDIEELKNYLAVHDIRMTALSKDSRDFENALELENGTQYYAMLKSMNLNNNDTIKELLSYYSGSYCNALDNRSNIMYCLTERNYRFIDMVLGI